MKRAIPILLLLALAGGGYYWWTTRAATAAPLFTPQAQSTQITGSGTIEAEIVAITSEVGGRITAFHADEGDEVKPGALLVELDPAALQAQRDQQQAALTAARANLANVSAPPRPEAVAAAQAAVQQAQASRDGAYAVWQQAQTVVANPLELNAQVDSTRGQIAMLQQQVEAAQAAQKTADIQSEEAARNQSNDEGITQSQAAAKQAEAAKIGVDVTQAELAGARNQLALLIALRDKPLALIAQANSSRMAYVQATAAVTDAQAKLALAKASAMPEDIAIAQAQVQQAQAAVALADVQLGKLTLTAPRGGIITERPLNVGELAAPGAILLNLGDLDHVTLTVFIPETQIGRVNPQNHQLARVYVDAYPGETFEGEVIFIRPEAEFTPKNVQTQEERVNLVFAVKIALKNRTDAHGEYMLKPGMPADAVIVE
jgi:HlyD family secretion protein